MKTLALAACALVGLGLGAYAALFVHFFRETR